MRLKWISACKLANNEECGGRESAKRCEIKNLCEEISAKLCDFTINFQPQVSPRAMLRAMLFTNNSLMFTRF